MTEILYSHVIIYTFSAVCKKDPEQSDLLFVRRITDRLQPFRSQGSQEQTVTQYSEVRRQSACADVIVYCANRSME